MNETQETKTRNIKNYPHKVFHLMNNLSGEIDTYYAVPTQFALNGETGFLRVEVFVNDDFNNYEPSLGHYNRTLPVTKTVVESYAELFEAVKQNGLSYLGADENFTLEQIEISLQDLSVNLSAHHKENKENWTIRRRTASPEEFEAVKSDYPLIVQGFIKFAFEYMATNKQFAKFE